MAASSVTTLGIDKVLRRGQAYHVDDGPIPLVESQIDMIDSISTFWTYHSSKFEDV
jgi:hypothetical protein